MLSSDQALELKLFLFSFLNYGDTRAQCQWHPVFFYLEENPNCSSEIDLDRTGLIRFAIILDMIL
jgi:hypothetical protein